MGIKKVKAAFITLGCKLNQFESEAIADSFSLLGADIVSVEDNADIYIVNTCTVTSKSEQKARRIIRKIAKDFPYSAVIVTGCYAQLERDAINNIADNLVVVPQDRKELLLKLPDFIFDHGFDRIDFINFLKEVVDNSDFSENSFYTIKNEYTFHSRAFLKIQDGCNNICKYCRVPLARGKSRSMEYSDVILNIKNLEKTGYREVVLTGVNISSYKSDATDLILLIEKILDNTEKIRIRFSSIEPDSIDKRYLNIIGKERICSHFHLPVQSGSDSILASMGRRYSRDKVIEAVEILRSACVNPLISADIITGFPGETERDFKDTFDLAEQAALSYLHVFPFSKRPGTAASKMKNVIPERVSRERAETLRVLSNKLFYNYALLWKNQKVEALLEGICDKAGKEWSALSGNYLKLAVSGVPVSSGKDLKGSIVECMVKEHKADIGNCFAAEFISLIP
ncbi:MAG: tRNA (N(6)-L-threonylcarbamoyladenosine(37)-C(2))-methylthiotransferase MtaB [Spirochaetaceae bacterium]|nr:tRNA (N(6)-L-threonylcarbamoyladenosine(37)-C(2))-methylthiotransferase MtaB [Spirochaetaceae bacterium]